MKYTFITFIATSLLLFSLSAWSDSTTEEILLTDLSDPDKVELSEYIQGAPPSIDQFKASIDDLLESRVSSGQ